MSAVGEDGKEHEKLRAAAANDKGTAPAAASKADIIARNKAALEKRRASAAKAKEDEAAAVLPEGWRRVESNSRPGEFVYENVNTEERQAWFPTEAAAEEVSAAAVSMTEDEKAREKLKKKNAAALAKRKNDAAKKKEAEAKLDLPDGWSRVESRSRPGEFVYENSVTGERQAWFPDEPVAKGGASEDLKARNAAALAKRKAAIGAKKDEDAKKPLPEGWKRIESRSRPGEMVYENTYTEERQAWFPDGPAAKPLPAGWRKVESRTYPGEFVYENLHTLERQAWEPTQAASLTEDQVVMPQAEQVKKAEEKTKKKYIGKAKALYDYTAENRDEEIDILENDIIQIEYKADNGWWVGHNVRTNRNGIFPGTYVEMM